MKIQCFFSNRKFVSSTGDCILERSINVAVDKLYPEHPHDRLDRTRSRSHSRCSSFLFSLRSILFFPDAVSRRRSYWCWFRIYFFQTEVKFQAIQITTLRHKNTFSRETAVPTSYCVVLAQFLFFLFLRAIIFGTRRHSVPNEGVFAKIKPETRRSNNRILMRAKLLDVCLCVNETACTIVWEQRTKNNLKKEKEKRQWWGRNLSHFVTFLISFSCHVQWPMSKYIDSIYKV